MPRNRRRTNRTDVQAARRRAEIKVHIRELGLMSEEQYQHWCRNQGLGSGLHKSQAQIRSERKRAAADRGDALLTRQRGHTRNPCSTFRQIYTGSLKEGRLGADYLYRVRAGFSRLGDDATTRRSYLDLLLAVEAHGDRMFHVDPALPHLGAFSENTFVDGLARLASHRADWVRPLQDWVPDSRNPRRQFASLSRHLLARYDEVPAFLDAAWFGADSVELTRRQDWFVHMGSGGSLRTAPDMPVTLTKRMAHLFLQADDELTPEEALRWAQVTGQGGDDDLAWEVLRSRLGRDFAHEDFWSSVITFLVRTPELGLQHVGPVVDYLQQQKFEPVERRLPGGEVEIDGPLQPNLTMKSRSVDKLLRQVDQWHKDLAAQAQIENETSARRSAGRIYKREWGAEIADFEFTERKGHGVERVVWSVRQLRNRAELATEGREMHHCAVSLASKCRSGVTSVWSLGVKLGTGRRVQVLTLAVESATRRITEVRGRYNSRP